MRPYFSERYGNASSQHEEGATAQQAVQVARQQVADLIGADFRRANLIGADLWEANSGCANFDEADLTGARQTDISLTGIRGRLIR